MDMKTRIAEVFQKQFGGEGAFFASSGRINLIGEHTDYNGGYVFPGAIDKCLMAEIRLNGTDKVRAFSIDCDDYCEFGLEEADKPAALWARYIFGVCRETRKRGGKVEGFDTVLAGDVPLGAGLSSSAALESTYAFAINELFGNKIGSFELARIGQSTEHNYCGVNCGIMDQFASVFGKKGHLMRLDCRSGEFQYFPWNPKEYRLVLINSRVKHELVGSPYNDRRRSCENVVAAINAKFPELKAETLRDCTWDHLEAVKDTCDPVDIKRAKFVLGEVDRVLAVSDALERGDYETVGQKMYETHYGLSKDYEVSCEELDFLNDVAFDCGVTGSRIMGGGFGGCTINLVRNNLYELFTTTVVERFAEKYGKKPVVIPVVIGDGSRRLA